MPNWCYNEIDIDCGNEEALQIMNELTGKNGPVDFNSIIPMPTTIPNCAVNERMLLECLGVYCAMQQVPWPKLDAVRDKFIRGIYADYVNKTMVVTRQPHDVMELVGQLVHYNLTTYGYLFWYDWSRHNWGVKWNASDSDVVHIDNGGVFVSFYSPWGMPHLIIDQLSKNHPNAKFTVYLSGEIDKDYTYTLQNGVWKENGQIVDLY